MYNDMAKAWILKAGKKCFISLFTDPILNLDYDEKPEDPKGQPMPKGEYMQRIMRLRVRAKGLVEALTEAISSPSLQPPAPLLLFLGGFLKPGTFVPDNFLMSYELNKVKLNSFGAFTDGGVTLIQKRMIIGFFMLIKITVGRILLNPGKSGFGGGNILLSDKSIKNFKLIASAIAHALIDYMDDITTDPRSKQKLEPGAIPELDTYILTRKEIGPMYVESYTTVAIGGLPPR